MRKPCPLCVHKRTVGRRHLACAAFLAIALRWLASNLRVRLAFIKLANSGPFGNRGRCRFFVAVSMSEASRRGRRRFVSRFSIRLSAARSSTITSARPSDCNSGPRLTGRSRVSEQVPAACLYNFLEAPRVRRRPLMSC
jgi:hypothetical protein